MYVNQVFEKVYNSIGKSKYLMQFITDMDIEKSQIQ